MLDRSWLKPEEVRLPCARCGGGGCDDGGCCRNRRGDSVRDGCGAAVCGGVPLPIDGELFFILVIDG